MSLDREKRIRVSEAATRRQAERKAGARRLPTAGGDRGWTREELYKVRHCRGAAAYQAKWFDRPQ